MVDSVLRRLEDIHPPVEVMFVKSGEYACIGRLVAGAKYGKDELKVIGVSTSICDILLLIVFGKEVPVGHLSFSTCFLPPFMLFLKTSQTR